MTGTAPHVVACSVCTFADKVIRREARRNERRLRQSLPLDLTAIERAKQDKADCAAGGHHNSKAGPNARWESNR